MGPLDWVAENLGLTVLTLVCVGLTLYLVYTMIHPEEF
jgi:F subunit of K+-transporting ATPase (Potass_KdpF)